MSIVRTFFLLAALLAACSDDQSGDSAFANYRDVVGEHLGLLESYGLPETDQKAVQEVRELLDAAELGGRIGGRASRQLREMDASALCAALLSIVEGRDFEDPIRPAAYRWLHEHALPAAIPRLVLRFKYEKDWTANALIASALLAFDNGAGLEALASILETEEGVPGLETARAEAAAAIQRLPARNGWIPGADFSLDWSRLLEASLEWEKTRKLTRDPPAGDPLPAAIQAEIWRMIARFESQPLRPVDDARYVLTRLDGLVIPELCAVLEDDSHYVREHALQTLAWMGNAVGWWSRENGFAYLERLERALEDPSQRTRTLEALGACGLAEAAPTLLEWARNGDHEEATAAIDGLLRCAGTDQRDGVAALRDESQFLPPEARYSLDLLLQDLDRHGRAVEVPADLDTAEKDRRDRWSSARADRPGAGN